jgi:hypothetical protein
MIFETAPVPQYGESGALREREERLEPRHRVGAIGRPVVVILTVYAVLSDKLTHDAFGRRLVLRKLGRRRSRKHSVPEFKEQATYATELRLARGLVELGAVVAQHVRRCHGRECEAIRVARARVNSSDIVRVERIVAVVAGRVRFVALLSGGLSVEESRG